MSPEERNKRRRSLRFRKKAAHKNRLLTPKDMSRLWMKVAALIRREIGTDDEGDAKVQFVLVNRTNCMPFHFAPVPYDTPTERRQTVDWRQIERSLSLNLSIAADQMNMFFKMRDHEYAQKVERETVREAVAKFYRKATRFAAPTTVGAYAKFLEDHHHVRHTSSEIVKMLDPGRGGQCEGFKLIRPTVETDTIVPLENYIIIKDLKHESTRRNRRSGQVSAGH